MKWIAERLRRIADRVDYAGAPKGMGWSFTFEPGKGIQFNQDRRGCPLWYLGDADYARAHDEAGPEPRCGAWAQDAAGAPMVWHPGSVLSWDEMKP